MRVLIAMIVVMVACTGGCTVAYGQAMRRVTKRFALCLDNTGSEASLILGKVYRIVPDARAAKDDLLRVIDESGEDYLFAKDQFAFVALPQAVKKRILAFERAG